jgi:hypothetical protein
VNGLARIVFLKSSLYIAGETDVMSNWFNVASQDIDVVHVASAFAEASA